MFVNGVIVVSAVPLKTAKWEGHSPSELHQTLEVRVCPPSGVTSQVVFSGTPRTARPSDSPAVRGLGSRACPAVQLPESADLPQGSLSRLGGK